MLKRFRKFRGDTDKPNSPPGSPTHGDRGDTGQPDGSGLNLSQQSWDDSTTEGFLCPLCMNKFPSPEILQQHFETAHDDTADKQSQNTPSPAHDSQGFVCPICMAVLPTAGWLQHHFDQLHDAPEDYSDTWRQASQTAAGFLCPQCKEALPSGAALEAHFASKHGMGLDTSTTANRDGDVLALRQEIDDLRTTLKEEKWYSTELRKEMEKFQGSATPGGATDEEKVELDLIRQQLRASEESRILLSSEVGHLREQLADATAAKTSIQEAKTMIEQKAAKLSGEIVGAKARVDEIEGQRAGFEDHIRTLTEQLAERNRYVRGLESQLAQRPGADDVLVLRQELVHAQTLMDQMTQDQEKEKQKLEEEHARLKADFNKSESKLQDLQQMLHSAPRVEEIEALKATMAATSSSSEELHKIISDKEATIIEKVRNMEQLKVGLQEQVALIQTKEILLTEVQRNLAERNASLEEIKIQLKGTEAELVSRKEEVARLEERSKLMDSQTQEKGVTIDKIQAERSKTETLNNTLQAEKLRLAKDLEAAKLSFNQKEAELKEMSDSLIQLQQQIEKRDAKISEREKNMEDLEGKLAETRQNAQASSYEKDQQFTSLRAELEKTVSGLRQQEASSSDLQKHIADLQRQLQAEAQRVEEGRAHVRERDATLEEERRQAEVKVAKVRELEEMLGKVKDNVGRLEEERADLIAKIEAGEGVNTAINQLKQENSVLQERLSGAESNSEHVAKEHQEKVDDLHKQLQDAKATLHEITETSAKIEDSLKVNQEKLEETKVKVTQLEGDLQTKSELLLAAEMAKTTQRADLENHIKTVQNALDEKVNEVSKVKGQLDQVRQEHGEDSARALRLEVTVKEQTTTTNSLQQKVVALEADVAERSASLEQLKVGKAALQEDLQGQVDTALVKVAKTQTALVKSGETLRAVQAEKKTLEDELKGKRVDAKKLLEEHHKLEVEHHKKVEEFKKLEQGKRSVETQLKVAQDTISEKTAQLEKTQGTLESSMAKLKDQHTRSCAEATSVQSKLKQQIESLESNRMQLLEEKTKVTLTLEDTQAALTSCKHDLAGIKTALEKEKASSELTSSDLTQKAVHLDGLLTSYKEELVTQQGMMDKKVKVINDLQSEISELNATKLSLEQKVTKTEGMVACTMKELNEKGELLVRVKDDGSKKEESLKKELKEAAIREGKVQSLLDEAHAQGRHLEEQVQAGKGALAVLETANAATRKELSQQINASEENSKQATKTLEEVHEAKKNVENKLTDVKSQLQEVTSHRDELKQNQDTLKKTLIDQQQLYQDLGEAKGSLERELHATVTTAQKDKVDSDRELKEHKEARELLIGQKVELQAQVTSLGTTLATLRTQYDESREEADTVQAQLRAESSELQGKLVSLEEARLAVVRDKEQWTAQHELQVAAMHENLATIRGDMATAQKRLAEADKANEDLRGEKLELEAKLDNNNGERRSLLERCLTSEAEVQQLQEKVTEVRRKLDNAQAALHELGRENQSLQIFTNKASSRKWADDNEVTYCMSCNKGFSMTVRKHHCRHCGNIFCNECSAKQATVAASKKPVRVCDSCYTDLTSRS